ncbi:katanin p80 WD40 repeat-containing subunit B1 [Onthophagus taurus]|uniref:katanin p80 WD40 repeat-containing subunit B1 n=1 Tax=Onthophagus taurus TaxID=166361 RepID=UPI000C1FF6A9|nr:katanin p80 WD40 repeat-containing subunit B1 [Onthophagus taurus]
MASVYKRSHKLQEFVAHNANVNCLSLGRKSGRVMVTGGDDKKVNLWAIGKQSCFMSLCSHTTPIECVQFNHSEEVVIAGSRAGAIKVWDLEAAKLVRTLTGHTDGIKCIDFHPYGDYLASGSADCLVKFWDSRKKGCIFTYCGHKGRVNSLKFSPDGYWLASGSEDGSVKIWDIRVGRILREFNDHIGSVTSVTFHPHEFLLATGGTDRTVNFFDLENFNLVSTEKNVGSIRCLCFNPGGECLFTGVQDYMKVVGWEPTKLYDTEATMWGRVCDISTAQNQLVGASFHQTNVAVYLIDLQKVRPIGRSNDVLNNPFTPNQSTRKSFSKAEKPVGLRNKSTIEVKTIEESTSGTDPEEDSTADITNLKDYNEIFHGRSLVRTPPPLDSYLYEDNGIETITDPTAPQILVNERWNNTEHPSSLDERINCVPFPKPVKNPPSPYTRSKSNLDQVYSTKIAKAEKDEVQTNKPKVQQAPKHAIQRQHSRGNAQEKTNNHRNNNAIKHSASDANISKSLSSARQNNHVRKNSFSKPNRILSVPNVTSSKIPLNSNRSEHNVPKSVPIMQTQPIDIYVSPKSSPEESLQNNEFDDFIPVSIDKPVGLDLDDFLPKSARSFGMQQQLPDMSETEVLGVILGGHVPMLSVLKSRKRQLQIVLTQYHSKDMKSGVETALTFNDLALIIDLLGIINQKYTLWNLDICVLLLPKIEELLLTKYESYITRACNSLKLILRHFGSVIKSNIQSPVGSFGVDIPREERYRKSQKCHESIMSIKSVLGKKISIPGNVGSTIKEIYTQIKSMFD